MIVMPPYGRLDTEEIAFEPKAIISGQLEITGEEIVPVDEGEIMRVARRIIAEKKVKAFAVSGYAGSINPAHELKVKRIIRKETGLFVTCRHQRPSGSPADGGQDFKYGRRYPDFPGPNHPRPTERPARFSRQQSSLPDGGDRKLIPARPGSLNHTYIAYLLVIGLALEYFRNTILVQRPHPIFYGLGSNRIGRPSFLNDHFNFFGSDEEFV